MSHCRARRSFTLVELLVVITIIATLMAAVLAGMDVARNAAQVSRTRATISKLHQLIMDKYNSYRTRRVPLVDKNGNPLVDSSGNPVAGYAAAKARLWIIRDIMRQEMPERPMDVDPNGSNGGKPMSFSVTGISGQVTAPLTGLFMTYQNYFKQMASQGRPYPSNKQVWFGPAEMLYMVVTIGCPNGRQQFSEDEIGDADGNGWQEFIDAWGNPIKFLRWAPGFTDSSIQLTPGAPMPGQPGQQITVQYAAQQQHDPFDPANVEPNAYQLIPLIYSAGPDGVYDVQSNDTNYSWFQNHSPYGSGGSNPNKLIGGLTNTLEDVSKTAHVFPGHPLSCYDNIHNHRLGN